MFTGGGGGGGGRRTSNESRLIGVELAEVARTQNRDAFVAEFADAHPGSLGEVHVVEVIESVVEGFPREGSLVRGAG